MKYKDIEEIVVHPVDGMQLSSGVIRRDGQHHFVGSLPGMNVQDGDSIEDVLRGIDRKAKAFYGDDVVVELAHHGSAF
ncbi:MAG: hypothetical protein JXR25_03540 [Pontiellaceae bacterium]|nr:hypothetical protein [Pontiellaceae bacterium]MBN2783875.1 hypothetical protein [Pontiellaceae bacterium]